MMNRSEPDADTRSQRFDELLAEYEVRRDEGQAVDREQFIREHPEFENGLRKHWGDVDLIRAFADTQATDVPSVTLQPGFCFGDYELVELLGRGGMGVVYKARQKTLDRTVAVKMLLPHREGSREDIQRFFGEAEAAARLQHPHIVRIHDVGEKLGHPFFSMDYVEGQSLAKAIVDNPLPPKKAAEHVRKIAEAMQFAHEHGVIHRDLKPSNVLIDRHGEPRITDFGLAKRIDCDSKLTATGVPMGTLSYMPAEQAQGRWQEVGIHSDVYSLGATLYDLLVGRPPFRAATVSDLIVQVVSHEPVSPRDLNPAIQRDLETICLKCLQKKPRDRYASAGELADDLARYLRGEPIRARPISHLERTWRWCRRYPLAVAAIASLAVGLCLAIVFFWHAELARREAVAARVEADANFRDARAAVDDLLTTVSNDTLLNQPGFQPLRRALLERAREYYERFRRRSSAGSSTTLEDARIAYGLARINRMLGEDSRAHKLSVEASTALAELHLQSPNDPEVLDVYSAVLMEVGNSSHERQEFDEATARYAQAGELRRRLKQSLETATGRSWLERQPPAVQQRLRCVDRLIANTVKNRGDVELDRWRAEGRDATALASWEKARDLMKSARESLAELAEVVPQDPDVRHDLAQAEYTLGRCFLALKKSNPLTDADQQTQALRGAEEHLRNSVQQFETLLTEKDRRPEARQHFDYLDAQCRHATALRVWGDTLLSLSLFGQDGEQHLAAAQATEQHRAATQAFETLATGNPAVPAYQLEWAKACQNLAISLLKLPDGPDEGGGEARFEEIEHQVLQAKKILDELDAKYPDEPSLRDGCQALRETLQPLEQLINASTDARREEIELEFPPGLPTA